MPWRSVSTTWQDWRRTRGGLSNLHRDEERQQIRAAAVRWERGEVNPYGGGVRTRFTFQCRPQEAELIAVLEAIARSWFSWGTVFNKMPVLLIEREGLTSEGERIDYEINGTREDPWSGSEGELRVRLPIEEDHLLTTDGFVFRRMGFDRQLTVFTDLSPVLTEVVEHFGFPYRRHEPTTDTPVAVVCIGPLKITDVADIRRILGEAARLDCQVSLTLQAAEFPKRYHAKMLLRKRDGEWSFTFALVGGTREWRGRLIESFERSGPQIPDEATVSFLESYVAPPKESWLSRIKLPDTRLGRIAAAVLGFAAIPFVAVGGLLGSGFATARGGLSTAAASASTPFVKLWRSVVTEPWERREREQRLRLGALVDLFDTLKVPPQSHRVETCFLAVTPEVEKNPASFKEKAAQENQGQSSAAEGGA